MEAKRITKDIDIQITLSELDANDLRGLLLHIPRSTLGPSMADFHMRITDLIGKPLGFDCVHPSNQEKPNE